MSLTRFVRDTVVATEKTPIAEVAARMRDGSVGCVIVIRDGRPLGIVTDRDIALRVVADGRRPDLTCAADVMTECAVTVRRDAGIETAARLMRDRGVRRLPIVDEEGRAVGIVTADDLITLLSQELTDVGAGIGENVDNLDSR
jgi:CBS domain-containing protein